MSGALDAFVAWGELGFEWQQVKFKLQVNFFALQDRIWWLIQVCAFMHITQSDFSLKVALEKEGGPGRWRESADRGESSGEKVPKKSANAPPRFKARLLLLKFFLSLIS